MKNWPLAFQIWVVLAGILVAISIILAILFPMTLRQFFTSEIYSSIEGEQHVLTQAQLPQNDQNRLLDDQFDGSDRSVNHVLLPLNTSVIFYSGDLPKDFIMKSQQIALAQSSISARYAATVNGERLYYVVRKVQLDGQPAYLLSYARDAYLDELTFTLFRQLGLLMLAVFLLSWIPSLLLAKYLTKPLVTLQKHVKRLSKQKWHDPVEVDRHDEIGHLGQSIEDMRRKLVQKDEAQRTLLQNISHDLKTPVMVIRGYAQSVSDGVFPKGDLPKTMEVVEQEAQRLETKIKNLLYLTKLDYLSRREMYAEDFRLDQVLSDVLERLKWTRQEIELYTKLDEVTLNGDRDQWGNLIENVLENQLRFASSKVTIELFDRDKEIVLIVSNDGPKIEKDVEKEMFEPFHKGNDMGQTGVGLSIVKRIVDLHHGVISIENQVDEGVFYRIAVPKQRTNDQ
ncbi:sensor histidine kinase [Aureibacillus halotolerans]|uniref:histidine kinase n=1 Tax=Aureibacillus halotolerans TaxID=1508390 RepID=A0A4R6TUD5_9BACI|nr:HAMP domain-containing sensor histidine kinase [Aureibacillus halotolerans]TDQ36746.1 two-component system sensor histidine kinase CssS [Aureibacillus halotolerans]